MRDVFIVGSKGIPAAYGGFETFVEKLTEYNTPDSGIRYHVACLADEDGEAEYHGAHCFHLKVPHVGGPRMVICDVKAMAYCIRYIKEHQLEDPVLYVLTCRIGPWFKRFRKQAEALGGKLCVNPDGHEWLRSKWPLPVRWYWKKSEAMMLKEASAIVCDSRNIEKYVCETYKKYRPQTLYIPYGADFAGTCSKETQEAADSWYAKNGLSPSSYYLAVGRFVPENNLEAILRGFMKSGTKRSLVFITNAEENRFMKKLRETTHFEKDTRIKFVGTIYDSALLQKIREDAFAYIHGHEVGGTNPSLLEALACTRLNLLLDVKFNREVGEDGAIYWEKDNLTQAIDRAEKMGEKEINRLAGLARGRIQEVFNWNCVVKSYREFFKKL